MEYGFASAKDGALNRTRGALRRFLGRRGAVVFAGLAAAAICLAGGLARADSLQAAGSDQVGQPGTKTVKKNAVSDQQRKMFEATEVKQPANFDECVRVALIQSPNFLKSSLEIEVKKLDEGDAMSQYIPTLTVGTQYYLRNPNLDIINPTRAQLDQKPYTFTFSAGGWNPVQTFFDNKAKEGLSKLAVEAHLEVINAGLKEIATLFLQIGFSQKNRDLTAQRLELAKQNLQYVQTRVSLGYAKPLDLDIAKTRVDMAQAESEKNEATHATLVNGLKAIIGMQASQKLEVDTSNFADQVLRGYTPSMATADKAKETSNELRRAEIQRDLQRKSIILAYVKYLPQLGFGLSTPDPVNGAGSRWGLYPFLTLSMSLDWLTKTRDVSRQRFMLEQASTTTHSTEMKIENTMQTAQTNYRSLEAALRFSASKVELAKLTEQQTQLEFGGSQTTGGEGAGSTGSKVDYDKLLADRLSLLEAKQGQLADEFRRDGALLDLKYLSGDLRGQYVKVNPLELSQ
ncbi:MAG: TolC family protein [Desulfovibrionaceae bacterium]|nr:TolC family protein [Desulfovibrionaceae bacterium]MBF0514587.1 TolC family protein [Desulfovibrionaceae bacterium]